MACTLILSARPSVPVPDNQTDNFVIAQFTVQDTNPVWVYCRQTGHCQQGMVFAINPGNNFGLFQSNAIGSASASASTSTATHPSIQSHRVLDASSERGAARAGFVESSTED